MRPAKLLSVRADTALASCRWGRLQTVKRTQQQPARVVYVGSVRPFLNSGSTLGCGLLQPRNGKASLIRSSCCHHSLSY